MEYDVGGVEEPNGRAGNLTLRVSAFHNGTCWADVSNSSRRDCYRGKCSGAAAPQQAPRKNRPIS